MTIGDVTMKFFTGNGEIATIRVDQATAHKCCNTSLEITRKKSKNKEGAQPQGSSKVMLVNLNARRWERRRSELDGELEVVQVRKELD